MREHGGDAEEIDSGCGWEMRQHRGDAMRLILVVGER